MLNNPAMLHPASFWLPPLIMFSAFGVIFAIGNGFVAARLGKPVVLWVILSLVPGVNFFFLYYVFYAIVIGILRRLNAIADKIGALPA